METILLTSLSIAAILFVWFKTGVFVEYVRALNLDKLFQVDKYLESNKTKHKSFHTWLGMTHGNKFLVRLILCPFCIGFWLSVLASLFTSGLHTALAIYCLSIIVYLFILKLLKSA
jgi:hypothetical protein